MLVPIVYAGLDLGNEVFQFFDFVARRWAILDGSVGEKLGEDGFLSFGEAQEMWRRKGEDGFKLKILATKDIDLLLPRL